MVNFEEPVPYTLSNDFLLDREAIINRERKTSKTFDELCNSYFSTGGSFDGLYSHALLAKAMTLTI